MHQNIYEHLARILCQTGNSTFLRLLTLSHLSPAGCSPAVLHWNTGVLYEALIMQNTFYFTVSSLHHSRLPSSCHQPLCFSSVQNYFLCLRPSKLPTSFFFNWKKKKSLLFLTVLGMCPLFLSNVCLLQARFSCHSVPSSPGSSINLIPTTYSQQHYFQENCHPLWDRHTKQQQRPLRRNLESNNGVTMEINRDRE